MLQYYLSVTCNRGGDSSDTDTRAPALCRPVPVCPQCTDVHPALPALRCTVTGTVQLYTTPTHVVPSSCGGMQGWDVFEFIINCMSLLNIAHARHCPHRSRWLPWPGARIISTKTVRAGDAEGRANSAGYKIQSLGWKFIWRRLWRYFSVLWEIFICGVNTGQYVWQPPGPGPDKPDKTRIDYPGHLCGRLWRSSG